MCRSIKTLRSEESPATDEEVEAAALQFVRKVSGYRKPSKANEETFNDAVREITEASRRLLDTLVTPPRPTSRKRDSQDLPVVEEPVGPRA
jgi:hypothetical protein